MKLISLSQGLSTKVDDNYYEWLMRYTWCAHKNNNTHYAVTFINGRYFTMHRLIMKAERGELVDHADTDGLNNQEYNLRKCSRSQNGANGRRRGNNKYKGVSQTNSRFRAHIRVNYKLINLGSFNTDIEAATAYNEAASKYFGEFAQLNII